MASIVAAERGCIDAQGSNSGWRSEYGADSWMFQTASVGGKGTQIHRRDGDASTPGQKRRPDINNSARDVSAFSRVRMIVLCVIEEALEEAEEVEIVARIEERSEFGVLAGQGRLGSNDTSKAHWEVQMIVDYSGIPRLVINWLRNC